MTELGLTRDLCWCYLCFLSLLVSTVPWCHLAFPAPHWWHRWVWGHDWGELSCSLNTSLYASINLSHDLTRTALGSHSACGHAAQMLNNVCAASVLPGLIRHGTGKHLFVASPTYTLHRAQPTRMHIVVFVLYTYIVLVFRRQFFNQKIMSGSRQSEQPFMNKCFLLASALVEEKLFCWCKSH